MNIEVILPQGEVRGWHLMLLSRLDALGHRVGVQMRPAARTPFTLSILLHAEQALLLRRSSPLLVRSDVPVQSLEGQPDLAIDLAGASAANRVPTLRVGPVGGDELLASAATVAQGRLPSLDVTLDGTIFDTARPMIDNRFSLVRGVEDVLARTVSLLVKAVQRFGCEDMHHGGSHGGEASPGRLGRRGIASNYIRNLLPRMFRERLRRATSNTHAHWCVGYRLIEGPGVAETGGLGGSGWTRLPDNGSRFYADPFPFLFEGNYYLFVEDYEHARGKGAISVAQILPDGSATQPVPVLEESHHLSYPNVFTSKGEIWMLPEAGASGGLTLYRAVKFPLCWERHKTIIVDRELADATLLEHQGKLWLFASERDCAGSAADMMAVFHAEDLDGPWTPHPANPIVIDRAAARPGGNVVAAGGRLIIPLQDGTEIYGGALGLAEITELTTDRVGLREVVPVRTDGDWPYPMIHTLNRAGKLEVIDGIVA